MVETRAGGETQEMTPDPEATERWRRHWIVWQRERYREALRIVTTAQHVKR